VLCLLDDELLVSCEMLVKTRDLLLLLPLSIPKHGPTTVSVAAVAVPVPGIRNRSGNRALFPTLLMQARIHVLLGGALLLLMARAQSRGQGQDWSQAQGQDWSQVQGQA
jgi:hypothetical protein